MDPKTEQFCKIYTDFSGEPLSVPKQLTLNHFTGEELQKICEFYFNERLQTSSIRHFFIDDRKPDMRVTRLLWFIIGVIFSCVLMIIDKSQI